MIRQLGPPTFFVTFMTCINNWPTLIKTLLQLYKKHTNKKTIIKNGNSPIVRRLTKNDLIIICVRYYANRMNNFRKLFLNSSIMLG
jgi:hypothetical protein